MRMSSYSFFPLSNFERKPHSCYCSLSSEKVLLTSRLLFQSKGNSSLMISLPVSCVFTWRLLRVSLSLSHTYRPQFSVSLLVFFRVFPSFLLLEDTRSILWGGINNVTERGESVVLRKVHRRFSLSCLLTTPRKVPASRKVNQTDTKNENITMYTIIHSKLAQAEDHCPQVESRLDEYSRTCV